MKSKRTGTKYGGLARGLVRTRGRMNRTEQRFAEWLDVRKAAGEVIDYWFEAMSFRLTQPDTGRAVVYTPDFVVLLSDHTIEIVDVKGGAITDAALLRVKFAAEQFPLFKWTIAQWKSRTWTYRNL